MDSQTLMCLGFIVILILLVLCNFNLLFRNHESFENNFTDSSCCCDKNTIDKCNKYGKSCVCDYYDKNKYLCQNAY